MAEDNPGGYTPPPAAPWSGQAPPPPQPQLEQLAALVRDRTTAHAAALRALDEARRNETNTLNAINEAQKAFDAAVDELRGEAHGATDWGAKRQPAGNGGKGI